MISAKNCDRKTYSDVPHHTSKFEEKTSICIIDTVLSLTEVKEKSNEQMTRSEVVGGSPHPHSGPLSLSLRNTRVDSKAEYIPKLVSITLGGRN